MRAVIVMVVALLAGPAWAAQGPAGAGQTPSRRSGPPRPNEFVFARLRYSSGDWDYNPKVAANVLDAVVQYTTIPVYPEEIVIPADSEELSAFPFLFMTGLSLLGVVLGWNLRDHALASWRSGGSSATTTPSAGRSAPGG